MNEYKVFSLLRAAFFGTSAVLLQASCVNLLSVLSRFWGLSAINFQDFQHTSRLDQPAFASGSVASLKASECTDCRAGEAPNAERSQCMRCSDGHVSVRQQVTF